MSYCIGTMGSVVRFYAFPSNATHEVPYVLLDQLIVSEVSWFADKASAKAAALSAGLKTWRYVKI